MSKTIYLSEAQLQYILNEATALGKMGKSGRTSRAQKFAEVCNDNKLLLKQDLSLFKPEALAIMDNLIANCFENTAFLEVVLEDDDDEIFTDESARDFVNYRVKGGIAKDSQYSRALAQIKAAELNQAAAERKSRADANMTADDRIKKNRAEAKVNREAAYLNSLTDDTVNNPDYDFVRRKCLMYPATYLKGNTVYMFISSTGALTDANRKNIGQLKQTIRNNGYDVSQTFLKKDVSNKIGFMYFNVEKK